MRRPLPLAQQDDLAMPNRNASLWMEKSNILILDKKFQMLDMQNRILFWRH